jgi:hypothetical protein
MRHTGRHLSSHTLSLSVGTGNGDCFSHSSLLLGEANCPSCDPGRKAFCPGSFSNAYHGLLEVLEGGQVLPSYALVVAVVAARLGVV